MRILSYAITDKAGGKMTLDLIELALLWSLVLFCVLFKQKTRCSPAFVFIGCIFMVKSLEFKLYSWLY